MKRDATQSVYSVHKPKPIFPVMKEIKERFSPRFFADRPVTESDIQSMLEAARWAPSGRHHQPWFFYIAKKGSKGYPKLFSTLNKYNQLWAHTAPLLILACAEVQNEKGENPFALYDLGASVMSLILQAQSLGYYGRQMGLFDKEKVRKLVPLPTTLEPFVIIALGKIGDYLKAPKEIIEMELDPHPRKTKISQKL